MRLSGIVTVVCSGLLLFIACKKTENKDNNNNNPDPPAPTKKQMLEEGKWQLSASTATLKYMGKDTTIDVYKDKDECEKDDFILFGSNGVCTVDDNIKRCPGSSQLESMPWALLENDTKIALVDSNPDTLNLEVNSKEFKLSLTKLNSSGTPVSYIDIFKNIK